MADEVCVWVGGDGEGLVWVLVLRVVLGVVLMLVLCVMLRVSVMLVLMLVLLVRYSLCPRGPRGVIRFCLVLERGDQTRVVVVPRWDGFCGVAVLYGGEVRVLQCVRGPAYAGNVVCAQAHIE